MSAVYRGLDTRLDRPVAIKVMDARFSADQAFVDRFEREARSAAKIHHPNVVAVHDQGLDSDNVYLVMELVDGGTLRDLLSERGALGVPLALSIMEPVLAALAAAHQAGLVHRDVKPENVLIGVGGTVKVADFGLVRAVASVGTTSSSVILGTVAYLSPEQVTTGTATARGDVYSAGILLYEMLTGGPPYTGDTALSIAYRHVNDDVPAIPGLPPALEELVTRATRRDPVNRPLDAGAFLIELQRVRTSLSIPRVPVPVPHYHLVDRTMPVSAEEQVRALGLESAEEVTEVGAIPVVSSATMVARAPVGFTAMGPQGTKAMLRTDLPPPPLVAYHPPPMHSPPYGNQPPYPMTGGQPAMPLPPPPRPPNRRRLIVVWSIIGALLLAIGGTATWWFTSGRWTSVPTLAGQDRAAAEQALTNADLKPTAVTVRDNQIESGKVIRTDPGAGSRALRGESIKLIVSAGRPTVPDVQPGISLADAERAITTAELTPGHDDGRNEFDDTVPNGKVIRLDPQPGTQLNLGATVTIVLSKGPKPKPIPDVRGRTRDEAFGQLRDAGFEPYDATAEFSPDVDGGHVIRTDPAAGTEVDGNGSKRVGVVVSNAVSMPDLGQHTLTEANGIVAGLGLQLELAPLSSANPNGRVIAQSVPPGSRVQGGTKVQVIVFP
jgi:serine/threonine-protein kinase